MNSITHRGVLWVMSVTVSEEVSPGTMLGISNLTFLQQTITDTAEDFKLLLSGEIVGTITGSDDLGDVLLKHGWLVAYVNIINPTG